MDYTTITVFATFAIAAIQLALVIIILHFVLKPKVITIPRGKDGVVEKAIMTPHGTLMVEKKKRPSFNDDETLFLREN